MAASGVPGRELAETRTTTIRIPCAASLRAATKPSPPLLPGPHRTSTGPGPPRSATSDRAARDAAAAATMSAREVAATAVPACSMSRAPLTPRRCAFASVPVISAAVMGARSMASAQRAASPARSSSKSVGSSAGSRWPRGARAARSGVIIGGRQA
jgi:hypothetical protein